MARMEKIRMPHVLGSQIDDDDGRVRQSDLPGSAEEEISPAEIADTIQTDVAHASQACWTRELVPPEPPHRLVRLLPIGVMVEVVIMGSILVTLASGQFSWLEYILGLVGVSTPLVLLTRGFWLVSQDEVRARAAMMGIGARQREGGRGS